MRHGLGNLDRPIVAGGNPPVRVDRTRLSPADGYLLSRANGSASARSMIETAPLPVADVERSLLGFLCTGVLRYQTAKAPQPPIAGALAHPSSRALTRR